MIEHALNMAKRKPDFKSDSNTNDFKNEHTIIILRKEKKLIFHNLNYYISEFMLWAQKLTATSLDNSKSLALLLLLTSIQKLVNKFNE